jgi:ribosomal protein RSM22 (predicted rRNA methylase)
MVDLPDGLRAGLATVLDAVAAPGLAASVRRLGEQYRSGTPAGSPILTGPTDVAAYAAYRMPATYAAVRAALRQLALVVQGFRPRSLLDVAGGTGAAAWAAVEVFPGLAAVTVLDQVADALALGRRLAGHASHPALRSGDWRTWRFGRDAALPSADLVTISYLLGELSPPDTDALVAQAAATGAVVVVVEPGTPAGHARVLAARSALLDRGLAVLAPCPHQHPCPLPQVGDWCHFAARVSRSSLHRRLKDARLGHEDEKFSFVAAGPVGPVAAVGTPHHPPGRVLRHPLYRKGLVTLEVCASDGGARQERVSRRQGGTYRRARDTGWGDAWPPALRPGGPGGPDRTGHEERAEPVG